MTSLWTRCLKSPTSRLFVQPFIIHRSLVNCPHKWPVTWKMFPFDDVIMKPREGWGFSRVVASGSFKFNHVAGPSLSYLFMVNDPIFSLVIEVEQLFTVLEQWRTAVPKINWALSQSTHLFEFKVTYVLHAEHIACVITNCGHHEWVTPSLFSITL